MTEHQPSTGIDAALAALLGAAGLSGVLYAGAAGSAWLAGHRVPHARLLAGFVAFAHLGDPSATWGTPVGPAGLYWPVTAFAVAVAGLMGYGGWRLWRSAGTPARSVDPSHVDGLATRAEVRRAAGSKALLARSATLRPSISRPRPGDVGYRLGTARGVGCWASVEDSVLVLGPPRSGKGMNLVIPMVLDAPGAVVTTSTRPDNLAVTIAARARRGPVMVFDPQRLAHTPDVAALRWSLVRGCEQPQTAMIRAEALVADGARSGVENAGFWRTQALSVTRCMLHAAALDRRTPADLYRWSHAAGAAKEATTILAGHPAATPGWDRALDAVISADQRTRDSTWAMVANTFAPLADPAVLAAVTPKDGHEFDPVAFLAMRGSVYLLGTATGASATASLVAALIEDLIDAARRLAARSAGQRLDPPLALILDEAANYPLPSLPALMSEGGGSGITTVAVLQSLAQARDRWGREAGGAIWDSAIAKVILGGSANADDLGDISRLIGDREVIEWSETRAGGAAGLSMSSTTRHRPILEPSELRRLPIGTGLLLLRSAPPIMMRLQPWTARADAAHLTAGRRARERQMLAGSTFAHIGAGEVVHGA
ncbi:TraM recognition domain-containing protein [Acidimicrobiaceae bacterium USS-CC1]|uniref:TraM recognition domain-containing protein n=1 Tax=Acidiferrimicrobium australe TaxID=2664430 RepID=A0ABW9QPE3_9ACTN|nr:TraM recognition domain-containing protein [Acidiferrimicrobium australe]